MPVPSAITDLSATPASNSPPGSESPSSIDDYLRSHASFIAQLRSALASAYAAASGTANAIVLTTNATAAKQTALTAGHQVRARISATNTGATTMALDGLTAKTCVTVTGAALPAGYIRTGVDTDFTYDSTGDRWVVGREVEYGSNANGEFWRYADGRLDCQASELSTDAVSNAVGSIFRSNTFTWTLPAAFIATPKGGEPRFTAVGYWSGSTGTAIESISMRAYSAASAAAATFNWAATGRWY